MAQSNVTDAPLMSDEEDQLGQNTYAEALSDFLVEAKAPTTIAIQGEWGSGKTSLMNSVAARLCINYSSLYDGITRENESLNYNAPYVGVWINTWQYSLLKDDKDALISVIDGVTRELSAQMNDFQRSSAKVKEAGRRLINSMAGFAMSAAKIGLSTVGVDPSSLDSIGEMLQSQQKGPAHFRRQLQEAVDNYLEEILANPNFQNAKGFIFFIDDLDRLDPPVAVQILSLLKNLFEVNHCIFVLAIDYEVVVKGLEKRFGKKTDANEREFRSFFDKIIQLTFRMPMDSYQTGSYLRENLRQISFCPPEMLTHQHFVDTLDQLTIMTCGRNPRSIKRMLNTLSLIHKVHEISQRRKGKGQSNILQQEIYLALLLAVVSIQVAYPALYEQLVRYPNLYLWAKPAEKRDEEDDRDGKDDDGEDDADDGQDNDAGKYLIDPSDFAIDSLVSSDSWMKKRRMMICSLLALIVRIIDEHQAASPDSGSERGNTAPFLRKVLEISHITSVNDEQQASTVTAVNSFEDFFAGMQNGGFAAAMLDTAKDFFRRLNAILPRDQVETEFSENRVRYLVQNAQTGRTVAVYEVQFRDSMWFSVWGGDAAGNEVQFNIGRESESSRRKRGRNKIVYESIDDVPRELLAALRQYFIDLTGIQDVGQWKVLPEYEALYIKFWRLFKEAAMGDQRLQDFTSGRENKVGDFFPRVEIPAHSLRLGCNPGRKNLAIQLYTEDKTVYARYENYRDAIETRLDGPVYWSGADKKTPSFRVSKSLDFSDRKQWDAAIKWLCSQSVEMMRIADGFGMR